MEAWSASLKDDVSAVSNRMGLSLAALDKKADELFNEANGNIRDFKKSLVAAGASTVDATLLAGKYGKALETARKEALGLGKASEDVWAKVEKANMKAAAQEEKRQKAADRAAERERSRSTVADKGGGSLFTAANAVTVARGAYDLTSTIVGKAASLGEDLVGSVLDAAQFRQNALSGLEYMLGSREAAVDIFKQAQKMAADTPLDTDKVIGGIKQLVTAGFSGDDATLLFKAVADQASKFADDPGMQDKVISAFSRVKGRGVATGEDLESFRVAGFRAEDIVQQLRSKENLAPLFKGIKPGASNEEIIKQVKEVLGKGSIGSTTFLNAALASLEKDKPDIGEFAKKMGKVSLTGTISNFKSAFGDLLKSTDVQSWEGVKAFQSFLTRITEAMSPASESGQRLLSIFQSVTDSLLGGLDRIESSDIEGFVKTLGTLGEKAVAVIKDAWGWLDQLLHSASPGEFLDDVKDVLVEVGVSIGIGVLKGMKDGAVAGGKALLGVGQEDYFSKYGYSKDTLSDLASEQGMSLKKFLPQFEEKKKLYDALGKGSWLGGGTMSQARDVLGVAGKVDNIAAAGENTRKDDYKDSAYSRMHAVGESAADGFRDGVKNRLDIKSPSRVMEQIGEFAAEGLMIGAQDGIDLKLDQSGWSNEMESLSTELASIAASAKEADLPRGFATSASAGENAAAGLSREARESSSAAASTRKEKSGGSGVNVNIARVDVAGYADPDAAGVAFVRAVRREIDAYVEDRAEEA